MRKSYCGLLAAVFAVLVGVLSLPPLAHADVTVQDPANVVGTGADAWSYLILEGENYDTKLNDTPGVGFIRVDASGAITSSQGNPVLGPNTTASNKGALFTQTVFQEHGDKVTYQVQFATPGTYCSPRPAPTICTCDLRCLRMAGI